MHLGYPQILPGLANSGKNPEPVRTASGSGSFIARLICLALVLPAIAVNTWAASLDIQKMRYKGAQQVKELNYFLETGLIAQRQTAIEMQIENFDRSLSTFKEARHTERNAALKQVQQVYEKFNGEFQAIADILRALVDKHQKAFNERNAEPIEDTTTREKVVATVEVGRQDETRALAAYNNRNFAYSAHLYLRSLKHYTRAFELRKWQPLVVMPSKPAKKPAKAKALPAR